MRQCKFWAFVLLLVWRHFGVEAFIALKAPSRFVQRKIHVSCCSKVKMSVAEARADTATKVIQEARRTDLFKMKRFHHIEFYCGDATNTARRFMWGLGMPMVAKSDQSTGNSQHASYVLQSNDVRFMFTAPYEDPDVAPIPSARESNKQHMSQASSPLPGFDKEIAHAFFKAHGLAVRAISIEVEDVTKAYEVCAANGGVSIVPPTQCDSGCWLAEVAIYGDVVLRFVTFPEGWEGEFLPGFRAIGSGESASTKGPISYGLKRIDHAVGNVWVLPEAQQRIQKMTGMHLFAEFTADDVGTANSGLNSVVLASDDEMVLLPLNEPTYGTPKKSQIQTYLEYNKGPGLQHLALMTDDIFTTLRLIRERSLMGGFEFMDPPNKEYYRALPSRIPSLTPKQLELIEELGLLADLDHDGVLLQIFTTPVGDRPTLFLEIIQRIGCEGMGEGGTQKPGCGGFGKGNFKALFESIERYEEKIGV